MLKLMKTASGALQLTILPTGNYSVTAVATNKAGAVSNPYTVSNLEIDATVDKTKYLGG